MADLPLSKICSRCRVPKPLDAFSPCKTGRFGRLNYCRPCQNAHSRERRQKNGDMIRAQERARRAIDPDARKAHERRANARRKQKPGFLEESRAAARRRAFARYIATDTTRVCEICGVQFCNIFGRHSWMAICSEACARQKGLRKRIRNEKVRRVRRRTSEWEVVDPFKVFERDNWRCHLCGAKTPKRLRGTYADRAPELDHVVSLADGGAHTYANTRCACRRCNRRKWSRSLGQLLLFSEPLASSCK